MRFPRASRLTRERDLEAVRLQGKRVRTGQLEVRYLASPLRVPEAGGPRIGIIVPRYGKSAVSRNTVKRRLRELTRLELLPMLAARPALDVVIRATPSAYGASYDVLRASLLKAGAQLPVALAPPLVPPLPVQPSSQDPERTP